MSLEKESLTVALSPVCLSLSLLFCLDLCSSRRACRAAYGLVHVYRGPSMGGTSTPRGGAVAVQICTFEQGGVHDGATPV